MDEMVFNFLQKKSLLDKIRLEDFSSPLTISNYIKSPDQFNGDNLPVEVRMAERVTKQGFSHFLDKLVVVDLLFGSVINNYFVANKRFPFLLDKSQFVGVEFGYEYLFTLWGHYRKRASDYVASEWDSIERSNVGIDQ